jgi:hypothetical protein
MTNTDIFPDGVIGNDNAVELFAPLAYDVTGYWLCSNNKCFRLSDAVNGYSVFYEALGEIDLSSNGSVRLLDSSEVPWRVVDSVAWLYVNPNHCIARIYDGADTWEEKRWPSIGFGNSSWVVTPTPTVTPTP